MSDWESELGGGLICRRITGRGWVCVCRCREGTMKRGRSDVALLLLRETSPFSTNAASGALSGAVEAVVSSTGVWQRRAPLISARVVPVVPPLDDVPR